jgi:hypothetical protein
MRVLSYTTESLRKIQTELEKEGVFAGHATTGKILDAMGYSKQVNQKMLQTGKLHLDRNAQFEYINAKAAAIALLILTALKLPRASGFLGIKPHCE